MDSKEYKLKVIKSSKIAIDELLKVIEEEIIATGKKGEDANTEDLAADKLKNAAATKKLAIFDAFEIIDRITKEEAILNPKEKVDEEPVEKKSPINFIGKHKRTTS